MVTIARFGKNADRADDAASVVALTAYAGAIRGPAMAAVPPPESFFGWSPIRQGELERALARWDNEGGVFLPGEASPAVRSPNVRPAGIPRYLNDIGAREIRIGAKAFHCIGALPPHDHPHIYLNMQGKPDIMCPYCATRYVYGEHLRPDETEPAGCFHAPAGSGGVS